MSLSQRWAEAKGMIWPTSRDVRIGAQGAGFRGYMHRYPTMQEAIEGVLDGGIQGYISTMIIQMNWGEGGGGETFVEAWNDYVREYRKCKQNWSNRGQHNWTGGASKSHIGCMEHAKRFVQYKYPLRDWGSQQNPPEREETWGYQPSAGQSSDTPFGQGLRVVTAASSKGSPPVARSLRRDVARGLATVRGNLLTPAAGPSTPTPEQADPPLTPLPTPEPVTPYTFDQGSIGRFWWLLIPVGFVLLSRRTPNA